MLVTKLLIILFLLSAFMMSLSLWLFIYNKIIILQWYISMMNSSPIMFPIILDPEGIMFSSTVLLISGSVYMFAISYKDSEMFKSRFIMILSLFVLSMNLLIFFPSLLTIMIGWDGLGIVSFLLVIYYHNNKSLATGVITLLTNRIGDILILLSIAYLLKTNQWNILNISMISLALSFLITTAAMTKSAQIPFSSWLPAAMAAPTPVSALVHSSTLVTAGVFLLYRFYPFLASFQLFFKFLLVMSTITMFMAGTAAISEQDLKKIVALSTLSQLGVMMASLSLGIYMFTLFHLITHALFKALLFVCAGSIINFYSHTQDIRSIGNSAFNMPILSSASLVSLTALCGFPFMAGFYSKDFIIEFNFMIPNNILIMTMFILATILTVFYSIRFFYFTQMISFNNNPNSYCSDMNKFLIIPMIILSTGAIIGWAVSNWILTIPTMETPILFMFKMTPIIIILSTPFIMMSLKYKPSPQNLLSSMWWLTPMSTQMLMKTPMSLINSMTKYTDQGWLEMTGPQGISNFLHLYLSNFIYSNKKFMNPISFILLFIMCLYIL